MSGWEQRHQQQGFRHRSIAPAFAGVCGQTGQLHSHWTSPNGIYCGIDSDEDSGIGHSNNGGAGNDRVGSTSSAEAEVVHLQPPPPPFDYLRCARPLKPWTLRGRYHHHHPPPIPHLTAIVRSASQRNRSMLPIVQPPPPPMLDSSESIDDVFHSFCAYLGGPTNCTRLDYNRQYNWRSNHSSGSRDCSSKLAETPLRPSRSPAKPPRISVVDDGHRCRTDLIDRVPPRRVWGYCGESSRYANIYENMHCPGARTPPIGNQRMMLNARARPVLSLEQQMSTTKSHRGPQRTHSSTSLASLITVDSDLIRVHAMPAAVVSVSEEHDGHRRPVDWRPPPSSASGCSDAGVVQGFYESIDCDAVKLNSRRCDAVTPPVVGHSTPKDSVLYSAAVIHGGHRVGEVQYAQVQKSKKSPRKSSNGFDLHDESEPPLPPRNYKRNSARNARGGNRSSLAERVQDFTRSAKQALRRALSLDALHGMQLAATVQRPSNTMYAADPRWDDDSDGDEWVDNEWRARRRPVAVYQTRSSPCRTTPATVKAKDAARIKPCVTLC